MNLAELTEYARCNSKRELVRLMERRQEELIDGLCGSRYSRDHRYRRGSSYTSGVSLRPGLGVFLERPRLAREPV